MAYWSPTQHGQSSKSSSGGGGPIQGPPQQCLVWPQGQQNQPDYRWQCLYIENVLYLGHEEPLPYQLPYYSGGFGEGAAYGLQTGYREVDDEGHYEHPVQQHTYASVVMQPALPPRPARQEHVPYTQPVNKALLQHLERAEQPVLATAAFLQDSLAVVVIEGLLDQIKMIKRQRVMALEHIEHAGKCKSPVYEEPVVEPKQARALVRQPQEFVWAPAPTVVQPPPPHVQPLSSSSTSMPVHSDPVMPRPIQEPDILAVVENSLAKLSLEPCDEIMANALAMQQGQRVEALYVPVMGSQAGLSSQREARLAPEISELKAQPVAVESHGLSAFLHALDVQGPTKHRPAQILFMHTISIPAPPPQFAVVILTTDPRTPEQYDGLVVTQQKTAAVSKGKGKAVAMIKNKSDYGQFSSEDEQELEEGESAAQRFQHVQQNKKLTTKKVNVAKAEAAQQHQAINDFSGHIPDGLGVKVWGPLIACLVA
ncbi:hypothetical protein C0995_009035 [Termitomyces sp. Mi166|nr:hypothetical protein C0995_009035 [Termitomyces sp. Mi166\